MKIRFSGFTGRQFDQANPNIGWPIIQLSQTFYPGCRSRHRSVLAFTQLRHSLITRKDSHSKGERNQNLLTSRHIEALPGVRRLLACYVFSSSGAVSGQVYNADARTSPSRR
jgi:hypothetical protein